LKKSELYSGVGDFGKIKQVLVEVHDLDNRVEKITDLLKTYGFARDYSRAGTCFQGD